MSRKSRKQWLLDIWDYHHGHLKPDHMEEIKTRLEQDPVARADAEKVNQIVNELRQAGRWETHPEFPGQMIDRILDSESRGMGPKVVAVAVALLVLWLVFRTVGGDKETTSPDSPSTPAQVEKAPEPTQAQTGQVPDSLFDSGAVGDIASDGPAPWAAPTPPKGMGTRLQLRNPVPAAEGDLDDWLKGPSKREDF